MTFATATLDDLFDIARGGSPRPIDQYITEDSDGVNWIMIGDASASSKYIERTKKKIKPSGVSRSRRVKPGDFLLTNSMSFGRPYILKTEGCIHDGWLVLSPRRNDVHPDYFYHLLGSDVIYAEFTRRAAGATVKNLNIDLVKGVEVQFPPLEEQRRIAAILDAADALRAKRRAALAKLDTLAQSIFIEMFGDPATNPRNWKRVRLGDTAQKFSDGPFGSNLKSAHYTETGVRVIRLQNIAVDRFVDDDVAYISEEHFETISKHECMPGDVLVGTLGDPNLRACIQPDWLPLALNKADCVQIRVNPNVATAEFMVALLNSPSTLKMAQSEILGQTRSRISMGRLRELVVPIPPVKLQSEFSERRKALSLVQSRFEGSVRQLETLFASLQHRAFRGERTAADEKVVAA